MSLKYTHKADYFLNAQLIIHHIENYIEKNPEATTASFYLGDIYKLLREDFASVTTSLDAILHIVSGYKVETLDGDRALVEKYSIDENSDGFLKLEFNPNALKSLQDGKTILPPDATEID